MNHVKIPKTFLDFSLSLKLSVIDVTKHSHIVDMDNNKKMTAYPNKNTTLVEKEATSSASEFLTAMDFIHIRL